MSSKRKSAPTKLATDEVLIQRERVGDNNSDGDSNSGIDSESELSDSPSLSLHIVSKPEQLDGIVANNTDSEHDSRPQSKKQRILQSVRTSEDSDSNGDVDSDSSYHNNNNNILTKPNGGLPIHRKSMNNVLRRLNSKNTDNNHGMHPSNMAMENGEEEVGLLDSVKAAINGAESVEDKERKLAEMIAQLQSIKDNIAQQKQSQVRLNK